MTWYFWHNKGEQHAQSHPPCIPILPNGAAHTYLYPEGRPWGPQVL